MGKQRLQRGNDSSLSAMSGRGGSSILVPQLQTTFPRGQGSHHISSINSIVAKGVSPCPPCIMGNITSVGPLSSWGSASGYVLQVDASRDPPEGINKLVNKTQLIRILNPIKVNPACYHSPRQQVESAMRHAKKSPQIQKGSSSVIHKDHAGKPGGTQAGLINRA